MRANSNYRGKNAHGPTSPHANIKINLKINDSKRMITTKNNLFQAEIYYNKYINKISFEN